MIGKLPIEGDIMLMMVFFFENKVRPDLLNSPKSIADALQGIVYRNDKQVTIGYLQCLYDKANPRVEVYASSIENTVPAEMIRQAQQESPVFASL
jgi:Holliday junction resolvase RusA-like endonuclease